MINKKILFSLLLIVGFFPVYAQEIPEEFYIHSQLYDNNASNPEISLSVDKFIYNPGEEINLLGYVVEVHQGVRVTIQVIDPIGNVRSQINVGTNEDGIFKVQNEIPDTLKSGEYTISAFYGTIGVPVSLIITIHIDTLETFVTIPSRSYLQGSKFNFVPQIVNVEAGLPIIWLNEDESVHTVVSGKLGITNKMFSDGLFDSGTFGPNAKYELVLEEGEYLYFCKLHPWLGGKIIVGPSTSIKELIQPSPEPESFEYFSINNAEDESLWSTSSCISCVSSVSLSSDNKQGSSSVRLTVKGDQDASGQSSSFGFAFESIDISTFDFIFFWIKTGGNSNFESQISLLDSQDRQAILTTFNSSSFPEWTEVKLPITEIMLENSEFDPHSLAGFSVKTPQGKFMKNSQIEIFLDDIKGMKTVVDPTPSSTEKSNNLSDFISVGTDKEIYIINESVLVQGEIKLREENLPVTVRVFDPGNNIITVNQITPNENLFYSFTIQTSGKNFNKIGDYMIDVQYGVNEYKHKTTFTLTSPTLIEEIYKGFKLFDMGNNFVAIPSIFEFDIDQLKSSKYPILLQATSLDQLRELINSRDFIGPYIIEDYKEYSVILYGGVFFGISDDEMDKITLQLGEHVTTAVTSNPSVLIHNPNTNTIYVANSGSNTVSVIDAATNTLVGTVDVGSRPSGIAVNPNTNTIYVANTGANTVSVIDAATNTLVGTVDVGSRPYGIAVNPNTNTIYVANSGSNTVSVIDAATNTLVGTVDVNKRPIDVAVNPNTDTIYVANSGSNTVSVIDVATNTLVGTINVGSRPSGIAVNPNTDTIYVANTGSNTVSVIDIATNTITGTINVENNAWDVSIRPQNNLIYLTHGINSISLIDGSRNEIVFTTTTGNEPRGLDVNLSSGHVFVANYGDNSVSTFSGPIFKSSDLLESVVNLKSDSKNGLKILIDEKIQSLPVIVPQNATLKVPSFPVSDEILVEIWNERNELQAAFPEVRDGNLDNMKKWAETEGWYQDSRLALLIPEGQIPDYLKEPQKVESQGITGYQIAIIVIAISAGGIIAYLFFKKKVHNDEKRETKFVS